MVYLQSSKPFQSNEMGRHFVPANTLIYTLRICIVSYDVVLVQHCWRIVDKWTHLAAEMLLNLPLI